MRTFEQRQEQFDLVQRILGIVGPYRINQPQYRALLKKAMSRVKNGEHAKEAQQTALNELLAEIKENELRAKVFCPSAPPGIGFYVGMHSDLRQPAVIHRDVFTRPTLISGRTGEGKSNTWKVIASQAIKQGLPIQIHDQKGECARFALQYPHSFVCDGGEYPLSPWEFVDDPDLWCLGVSAAIGEFGNLHDETWPELAKFMSQVLAGLKPGDAPPSWADTEELCRRKWQSTRDKRWQTITSRLGVLKPIIKRAWRIRKGPNMDQFPIQVLVYSDLPPEAQELVLTLQFLRISAEAARCSRPDCLQRLFIVDDGLEIWGKD